MVLNEQRGNCFDYAILLASLLIGVGYDAYCVCGYASEDVCLLNLGRHTCPLLQGKKEVLNRGFLLETICGSHRNISAEGKFIKIQTAITNGC